MTDRIKGFTVLLDKDYRDDDVEVISNAIKMIKGVAEVENHIVSSEDWFLESRTKGEIRHKLWDFIKENL